MRFMMLMIPKVYQGPEGRKAAASFNAGAEVVEAMLKYNQRLEEAGALISLDGLSPPAGATRISFSNGKATVTDGPQIESNDALGGYWMIDVKSRQEAIEWARQIPAQEGDVVEIRQVLEVSDFPAEVQGAAAAALRKLEAEVNAA